MLILNLFRGTGVLRVIGVRKNINDDHLWLFDEEDQNVVKHSFVHSEVKKQLVTNYRNVKVSGPHLSVYFDSTKNEFAFNGKLLTEDKEKSFKIGEDGGSLNLSIKITNGC